MANNQLTTRIVLRNDTTSGWSAVQSDASYKLLKGEVGIEFLDSGKVKMKIGDGTSTWAQLPYFGGDECKVTEVEVVKGANHLTSITNAVAGTTVNKGDIAIVKEAIIAADKLGTATQQYQYTAYVYGETSSGSAWKAMDGNYSAENVYFDEDLTYTQSVGALTLGSGKNSDTLSAAGKSLETVMKAILAVTKYSKKEDPKFSFDSTSATYTGLEVGSYITELKWNASYTDGSYSQGTIDKETGVYSTSTAAGCVASYSVSNDKNSETKNSQDGTFVLSETQKIQIDTVGAKNYAKISMKYGYAAPTKYPATNLGDRDTSCTEITARDISTATATDKNVSVSGFRNMFFKCFTAQPETLTSSYVRTNFNARKQDGNKIANASGNLGDYLEFDVPAGLKQLIVCLWNGKKIKSVLDEDNKWTTELKGSFELDTSTVAIEGANNFTSTAYSVYRLTPAGATNANKYRLWIES